MSKQAETPKHSYGKKPQKRCQFCGVWVANLERHTCGCEEEEFDGVCPMCGDEYRSYLDHLAECDP